MDKTIIDVTCGVFGITTDQFFSPDRHRQFSEARCVAVKLMRNQRMSIPAIAAAIRRTRSTVYHHLRMFPDLFLYSREFSWKYKGAAANAKLALQSPLSYVKEEVTFAAAELLKELDYPQNPYERGYDRDGIMCEDAVEKAILDACQYIYENE